MNFRRSTRPAERCGRAEADGCSIRRRRHPRPPAAEPLARLLAAAAAPARPGELAGEEAALARLPGGPGRRPVRAAPVDAVAG